MTPSSHAYQRTCRALLVGFVWVLTLLPSLIVEAADARTERLVSLIATVTVSNNGDQTLGPYFHSVTTPAEDHAQQRLLGIHYPYADAYTLNRHENGVDRYMRFAWTIPPRSSITREIRFDLNVASYNAAIEPLPESSADNSAFLLPSQYVESSSSEVMALAQQIRDSYPTLDQQLQAAYLYPQDNLQYLEIENRGALFALLHGYGDCTEYAAVFIALARAFGVPARMTSEFRFTPGATFPIPNHHAAEAYVDGAWTPVDPNLALNPSLGYGFGYGSNTKVVLKRGDSWTWANSHPNNSVSYVSNYVDIETTWRTVLTDTLTPIDDSATTLRDAIYLYGQAFNAKGDKVLAGENCDVFQLILDVDTGFTDLAMAQADSIDNALAAQGDYPDRIQASADMFAYTLYDDQAVKAFIFKDRNDPESASQIGSGTAFGYCFSANPAARVYLRERDTCTDRDSQGAVTPIPGC